jgi:preprotein translocase subunit SecF
MDLPNIYRSKHYRLFAILPIALFIISLYFIPHIQLDQTLRGGIAIQLQTNSIVNTQSLASMINSNITGAEATVTRSRGSVAISIAANDSISNAHNIVVQLYSLNSSYAQDSVDIAVYRSVLNSDPQNATAQGIISKLQANQTGYVGQMNTLLDQELAELKPMIGASNYSVKQNAMPSEIATNAQNAYSAADSAYKNKIMSFLSDHLSFSTYSYNDVTPTLGAFFLSQLRGIIIAAFVVVAIVVLVVFRSPAPALTVVFGSANDIIVALGAMAVLGIPLGVASIGGLLMLIGYSMDTDVLAAVRILKRSDETPEERAYESMKTGITLTFAAIITFSILLVVSYVVYIPTYFEISSVVLVGLVADLITTWMSNTPLLLWYKHRMEVHRQ